MFCHSCDRVELTASFVTTHWQPAEIEELLNFIGNDLPADLIERCQAITPPPSKVMLFARRAIQLDLSAEEWRKTCTLLLEWSNEDFTHDITSIAI